MTDGRSIGAEWGSHFVTRKLIGRQPAREHPAHSFVPSWHTGSGLEPVARHVHKDRTSPRAADQLQQQQSEADFSILFLQIHCLGISYMRRLCFRLYPPVPPLPFFLYPPPPLYSPVFMCSVFLNPLRPLSAIYMCKGTGPSIRAWVPVENCLSLSSTAIT